MNAHTLASTLVLFVTSAALAQPPSKPGKAPPLESDPRVLELISHGATMEEIASIRGPSVQSPDEALRALKAGNTRFFNGDAQRPELSANLRRTQILMQTPFAVIVGCADSRVPTEIVFDQGLGSLFTTRVAGNVVDPGVQGSVEYAVGHLKPQIVVVMGHEGCGAVHAALLPESVRAKEPKHVQTLLNQIVPAVSELPAIRDRKARMREAVLSNVRLQVSRLNENPVVKSAVAAKKIRVVGAFYEITSGAVDFIETPEELKVK